MKNPQEQTGQNKFSTLPGVDTLLSDKQIKPLLEKYPRTLVSFFIRETLNTIRKSVSEGNAIPEKEEIIRMIRSEIQALVTKSLKPVINATGVIIHTNLGRAPFGEELLKDAHDILTGYSNLEYDLEKAGRGSRYVHVTKLLKYLTGAEDILVVNNNAAAIMLVLRTFARNREVIVSRGELIEIGGSFRMPDIMKASDCEMVEVGTTNKTSITDYLNAIDTGTALLLKVHRSNYTIKGFTKEATLNELVELGKRTGIPVVYDMGSGLLRKPALPVLKDEPDVKTTLSAGIDLITFSGDKLLGGPQAGIIAGKHDMISKLKKEPMTRALRVGKETLSLLEALCIRYLDEEKFFRFSPIYRMMTTPAKQLQERAQRLKDLLMNAGVDARVVESFGQPGGGSLPGKTIKSFAVEVLPVQRSRKEKNEFCESIYHNLLKSNKPVLGVLRKGKLIFDVLTLRDDQLEKTSEIISTTYKEGLPT